MVMSIRKAHHAVYWAIFTPPQRLLHWVQSLSLVVPCAPQSVNPRSLTTRASSTQKTRHRRRHLSAAVKLGLTWAAGARHSHLTLASSIKASVSFSIEGREPVHLCCASRTCAVSSKLRPRTRRIMRTILCAASSGDVSRQRTPSLNRVEGGGF